MSKSEFIAYVKTLSVIVSAFLLLIFPSFFLTSATDFFIFPKQMLVIFAGIILLVLFLVRMIAEGRIMIRSTPFNVPVLAFVFIILISAFSSRSIYDALFQAVPVVFLGVIYFTVTNAVEDRLSFRLILYSLVIGALGASLITILHFFKIYIFPFPETQYASFNTFGASIQQIIYTLPVLLIALFHVMSFRKTREVNYDMIVFGASAVVILVSSALIVYQVIFSMQQFVVLPYVYGFQVALASISQESGRFIQSFLFGSGYGTFLTDFTRFKLPSFNMQQGIWNVLFSYSSSYFLELIATTGILGAAAFVFLLLKTFVVKTPGRPNVFHVALLFVFLLAFLLPLSFSVLFLLFMLLALYSCYLYLEKSHFVENISISLVAFKQGLINITELEEHKTVKGNSRALPVVVGFVCLLLCAAVGFAAVQLFSSDMKIRESLVMAAQNNGQRAYELQTQALSTFPYKGDYYRVFSQLNLALAGALASTLPADPKQQNPQTQQTILTLIQQSINSARTAVTISPMTVGNWQNLAQVYRNLINVGQNAAQFSIASMQQAIALDPYNPSLYLDLGGIYYQLGQYDLAQNQFQIAISMKRDFGNAYYNLGHALEAKGDLASALQAYQIVRSLVQNDKPNFDKINAEIAAIQEKIGKQQTSQQQTEQAGASGNQPPLEVNRPSTKLPEQKPPVKIPNPPISVTPAVSATPSVEPSVTPTQ